MIIDGKKIQEIQFADIRKKLNALLYKPVFTDILIGDDRVNKKYVEMKKKVATSLGFHYKDVYFSDGTAEQTIIDAICDLNKTPHMAGIIVQLPLPHGYNKDAILNAIDPQLDVDVLGSVASEKFYNNTQDIILPTAQAIFKIIDSVPLNLTDKKILILGQGPLVGKPVAHLLALKNIPFSVVTKQTPLAEKLKLLQNADVIISATGAPDSIIGDMIKEGVVVIDAGTSEMEGSIVGDVHFESVFPKASYITPSPGGVGPVTVGCLFENVCKRSML